MTYVLANQTAIAQKIKWLGAEQNQPRVNGGIIEITVHSFALGDVEDPEIYAAMPILKWEKSESGQWVMIHAVDKPTFYISMNYATYGYQCVIRAKLHEEDVTFYELKWGNK